MTKLLRSSSGRFRRMINSWLQLELRAPRPLLDGRRDPRQHAEISGQGFSFGSAAEQILKEPPHDASRRCRFWPLVPFAHQTAVECANRRKSGLAIRRL